MYLSDLTCKIGFSPNRTLLLTSAESPALQNVSKNVFFTFTHSQLKLVNTSNLLRASLAFAIKSSTGWLTVDG